MAPEKRLMLATLKDAVACFRTYTTTRRHREWAALLDAEEWIVERDRNWLYAFENFCDELGSDADAIRKERQDCIEENLAECSTQEEGQSVEP